MLPYNRILYQIITLHFKAFYGKITYVCQAIKRSVNYLYMDSLVKVLPKMKKFNNYITDVNKGNFPITLSGLSDSGKAHFIYATRFYTEKPVLVVTYNELELKKLKEDMKFFSTETVYTYPKKEVIYYDIDTMNKDATMDRLSIYTKLYNSESCVVLTTIEALMQKTISKDRLFFNVLQVEVGKTILLEELVSKLSELGYERTDMVEGRGQFCVRGGIIDVYPLTTENPVRIELWGDEVDSVRLFDVESQRTIESISEVNIFPAEEFLVSKENLNEIGDKILEKYPSAIGDVELIKNGNYLSKVDKYFEFFYHESSTLLDYLSKDTIIFLDEPTRIASKCESIEYDNKEFIEDFLDKNKIMPSYTKSMYSYMDLIILLEKKNIINLERVDNITHAKRNGYSFSCREVNFFRGSMDIFVQEVQESYDSGKVVLILGGTLSKARGIATMLLENKLPTVFLQDLDENLLDGILQNVGEKVFNEDGEIEESSSEKSKNKNQIIVIPGNLSEGIEYLNLNLIIATGELGTVKEKRRSYKPTAFKEGKKVVFADLSVGDYIVHSTHGIGQYVGIHTLEVEGVKRDYIKLKYRDDDVIYIPTSQLDNIRKYMGAGENAPKLNRLGSKEFANTKAKVKASLKDIAKGLIALYAKRRQLSGYKFSQDTVWQKEFEDSFPYQETDDQLRCIEEVKHDMESEHPMDRLLCGDVGYGKTEVAMRGAFKAVQDGKQVAYLVPTTVLAEQQYNSFKERMKDYPVNIEVLNRFKTTKQKNDILKRVKNGEIDILIGTHRIIQKDIQFKDLGFLIIDEEHRFGVAHKEKIKQLKENVDVLTMTATPIPRTMHMSIVGIRDMSVIYDPPHNRRPVQTYVLEYDKDVIREAIVKELEREGQVFYLYNRVEGIERKSSEISNMVPEARVAVAHGKMTGTELENIMKDFIDKKIDVLICTTILETGIDIPNANTIIIEDADRLGLAQLYQIRGRVGRSDRAAYAYITYKKSKVLAEASEKRLKAIKEFTEFGSGFKIALRDLEIRGAGNILGPEQHGHMEAVGYEMYCKLLDEAVREMQGESVLPEVDTQIDIQVTAYIPSSYIENVNQKIEVYQDIANIENEEQASEIIDELIDRYGDVPKEVYNLIEVAKIKSLARKLHIVKILQNGNNIVIHFNDPEKIPEGAIQVLIDIYKSQLLFSSGISPYITLKLQSKKDSDILGEVNKLLTTILKNEESK